MKNVIKRMLAMFCAAAMLLTSQGSAALAESGAIFGVAVLKDEPSVYYQTLDVELRSERPAAPAKAPAKAPTARQAQTRGSKITVSGELPEGAYAVGYAVTPALASDVELIDAYSIDVLDADGEAYEPDELYISMAVDTQIEAGQKLTVLGIASDGSAEEVAIDEITDGSVGFYDNGSPVYAVVKVTLEKTLVASDGNTYRITVTYDSESGLPTEGVELAVEEKDAAGYELAAAKALKNESAEVVRAFDISIIDGAGKKYQPTKDVAVSIELMGAGEAENLHVVHIGDASTDVITPATSETADGLSLSFMTGGFSIYIIAKDVLTKTYIFKNGEDLYSKQVLKNGESLVNPTAPVKPGAVFSHWSLIPRGEAVDFDDHKKIEISVTDADAGIIEGDTTEQKFQKKQKYLNDHPITLYAVYGAEQVVVTYYDQNGAVVERKAITKPAAGEGSVTEDTTQVTYVPVQDKEDVYQQFRYWTKNLFDENPINAGTLEITADSRDIALYPVVAEGHWIYFDGNKQAVGNGSISYTAPLFVINGGSKPTDAEVPISAGYTFKGWFTRKNRGDMVFNDTGALVQDGYQKLLAKDGNLANDPTVYAQWEANDSVSYTVIFWRQKITDNKDAADADKTYDFANSFPRTAATGSTVSLAADDSVMNERYQQYVGFHYNEAKSDQSAKVSGDGTTVLNVYYDRNLVTFTFLDYDYQTTTANTGTMYGLVNGKYVPLTWSSSTSLLGRTTYSYVYWADSNGNPYTSWSRYKADSDGKAVTVDSPETDMTTTQYRLNADNDAFIALSAKTYTGTRYTRKNTYKTLYTYTGLYGQRVTQYYPEGWPGDYLWITPNSTSEEKWYATTKSEFKNDETVIRDAEPGSSTIEYFQQTLTGDYPETANLVMRYAPNTGVTSGVAYNVFVGFTASEYRHKEDGVWSDWQSVSQWTERITLNQGLQVRFDRNKYQVSYWDSANGTQLTSMGTASVLYENTLTGAKPTTEPIRDGYDFTGWYYDKEGSVAKVDFENDTMPANNVQLYAGWRIKRFLVQIDPNGGELFNDTDRGNNYATWFRANYNEKISEYTNVTRDYVLAGEGVEATHKYVLNRYDPNDTGKPRTATYDDVSEDAEYIYKPGAYTLIGWFKVKADGTTESNPYNFDNPVTADITLRALWRRTGTFSIKYDADSVRAPIDATEYVDGAKAVAMESVAAPAGKVFDHWEDSKHNTYKPNQLVSINENIAVEDADGNLSITLTAFYREVDPGELYMADYVFMNGGEVYHTQTIATGEELVPPNPPEPDGESMIFNGWFLDSACTKRFDGFGVINYPVYTTLYAGFEGVYTVTYHMLDEDHNHTDEIVTTQHYAPGATLNTLYVDYPVDADHEVEYWKDKDDKWKDENDKILYPYKAITSTKVTSDLELWPVVAATRMLHFNSNGGTHIQPVKIPLHGWPARPVEPTREGYVFQGWFTTSTFEAESEYDFDVEVPDGVHTLYAKWDLDPVNPKSGRLNILWWAQTSDRPEDDTEDKEHYELITSAEIELPYGSYVAADFLSEHSGYKDLKTVVDQAVADEKSTAKAFSNRTGGTAKLDNYYMFNDAKTDANFAVDDSGDSTLNIRFDLRTYKFAFETRESGKTARLAEIHYGSETYAYNTEKSQYTFTVWLGRDISALWPIADAAREVDDSKAYVKWTSTTNNTYFSGWQPVGGSSNWVTLQPVADSAKIDAAKTAGGVLVYYITTTSYTKEATIRYFLQDVNGDFDDKYDEPSLRQAGYRFTEKNGSTNYVLNETDTTERQYYQQLKAKEIDGFTVITRTQYDKNDKHYNFYSKSSSSSDYAARAHYQPDTVSGGTIERDVYKTVYSYAISDAWEGTTFYHVTYKNVVGNIKWDPEYNPLTIILRNSGAKDDYTVTWSGGTKTGDAVYYQEKGQWKSMSWAKFTSEVIVETQEEVVERTETVQLPSDKVYYMNFYYRRNSYTLNLFRDATTSWHTEQVPYEKQLTGPNGLLRNYTPTAPAGMEFAGWSVAPGTLVEYVGTMPNHALTLYAVWEPKRVSVTTRGFGADGRETSDPDDDAVYWADYGTEFVDFDIDDAIAEGKLFNSWYLMEGDTETDNDKRMASTDAITEDIVVYPHWRDLEDRKVVYDVNGGEGTAPVDNHKYIPGAEVTVLPGTGLKIKREDMDHKTYEGNFVSWNTEKDGSGHVYYPGDEMVITEEHYKLIADEETGKQIKTVVLYAQYAKRREVTLVYNLNVTDGSARFVPAEEGSEEEIDEEDDGTVKLRFVDDSQIDYEAGDPGIGRANSMIVIGQDQSKVEFTAARTGYRFDGWSKDEHATDADIHNGDRAYVNTLGDGDNVLYAVWKPITLPVTVYKTVNGESTKQGVVRQPEPNADKYYDAFIHQTEDKIESAKVTADTWYNAPTKTGVSGEFYKAAVSGDGEDVEVRWVRFNAAANAWQYATAAGATAPTDDSEWTAFGDNALRLYYFPNPITPKVYWVFKDSEDRLTEIAEMSNVSRYKFTKPSVAVISTDAWLASTETGAQLVAPGMLKKNQAEKDAELVGFALGAKDTMDTSISDLTQQATLKSMYLQNTVDGVKYADSATGLATAAPRTGDFAIYVVYQEADDSNVPLTITKSVTGAMGDMTRGFTFKLDAVGSENGVTYKTVKGSVEGTIAVGDTFTLKHDESITIYLPKGKTITIVETDADYYTKTFTLAGASVATKTEEGTEVEDKVADGKKLVITGESATLTVVNRLDAVSPTGVTFTLAPYFFMLLEGIAVFMLRRKRKTL